MKDEQRESEEIKKYSEEWYIVCDMKAKKNERKIERKGDYQRENEENVTADTKQRERPDSAVFELHSTSDFP